MQVGYPSGQREQTVNLPAQAFEGSNPSPTITERDSQDQGVTKGSALVRLSVIDVGVYAAGGGLDLRE